VRTTSASQSAEAHLRSEVALRLHRIPGRLILAVLLAARLASDLNAQVLLFEAGGTDEKEIVLHPNRWPMTLSTELDWGFVAQLDPNLKGRAIGYSMGKVLGGGSSTNDSP
jgi:choline dehydrogenase-like flavoprotein